MSKINALRKAIETLSEEEYIQLRQWFSDKDWKKWDQEIEKDSKSGKLNSPTDGFQPPLTSHVGPKGTAAKK